MFLLFIFSTVPAFAQPATNKPSALAPAYGQIPQTFWNQHGTMIIIGGLTALLLFGVLLWMLLRTKMPLVVPPEILARQALSKLEGLPEDGNVLSEVSQILRRYVSTVFKLPPGELTTAEFFSALASNDKISVELGDAVSRFLRECDERKFSTAAVSTPFNAVPRALKLISLAEAHLASVPQPSSPHQTPNPQ